MITIPEDLESEVSLLATLCAPGNEQMASVEVGNIRDEDFHVPANRFMFQAVRSLLASGIEIGIATLADQLRTAGTLDRIGGVSTIVDTLGAPEISRPETLVKILRTRRHQRELQLLGGKLYREAALGDPAELMAETSAALSAMAQSSDQGNVEDISRFSDEALARVMDRMEGRSTVGTKFHGWRRLNGLTHGFQPGQLIVLAARPGIGKTALALNWLLGAGRNGRRCAFFSLEMPKEELWNRLIADKSGVNYRQMIEERNMDEFCKFAQSKGEVDAMPLHVSDRGKITVSEIAAQVDRIIVRHGSLDLLVIDYLQLLTSPAGGKNQTETIRIGEITRALKLLAKDRKIPILLLSQLNRDVEKRTAGKPQLSDLRDSGCIEQDADVVMFIHRSMNQTATDLIIAKHRNGPTMTLPLNFCPEITRYVEVERQTEPSEIYNPEPFSSLCEDLL